MIDFMVNLWCDVRI